MTPDLIAVDVSQSLEAAVGAQRGLTPAQFDHLVATGRRVHDDLLLARARGQVGFGDLYMLGREAMRARDAAESLAPRFESVAVLAPGAECDVASATLGALAHPFHNLLPRAGRAGRPRVVVVDSSDPDCLGGFFDAFAVEQSLIVIMAKRGADLAAIVPFALARDLVKKRLGPGFQDHLLVVTDARGGTLREEAARDGLLSFEIPANVPPRFAALTAVGLLPAAFAGVDVRGVLAGAHASAERTAGEDLRVNPAYLVASTLHLLATERGRTVHVFVASCAALEPMARHLSRLYAECMDRRAPDGQSTAGARVAPLALSLPRDQALLARLAAGDRGDLAIVFLDLAKSARERALPKEVPGAPRLGGRSLGDLSAASVAGMRRRLAEEHVPSLTIRIPALSPSAIGALHMTSMLGAAFAAGLRGIDPASSPGADDLRRAVDAEIDRPRE